MSDLILYTSEDGHTRLQLRADGKTIWLTQLEIAELFQTTKQNVSLHAKNIFEEGELGPDSVVKESLASAADGKRYRTQLYNLDLILAIGYRVRSPRGTQFQQWATTHLREFVVKGFVMDDERLKNPGGWDHFDELLARIREIRASEKRFYQKVRDLFALSSDYKVREQDTNLFFAEVQNKLLYAATGHTAAELIVKRGYQADRGPGEEAEGEEALNPVTVYPWPLQPRPNHARQRVPDLPASGCLRRLLPCARTCKAPFPIRADSRGFVFPYFNGLSGTLIFTDRR